MNSLHVPLGSKAVLPGTLLSRPPGCLNPRGKGMACATVSVVESLPSCKLPGLSDPRGKGSAAVEGPPFRKNEFVHRLLQPASAGECSNDDLVTAGGACASAAAGAAGAASPPAAAASGSSPPPSAAAAASSVLAAAAAFFDLDAPAPYDEVPPEELTATTSALIFVIPIFNQCMYLFTVRIHLRLHSIDFFVDKNDLISHTL